MGTGGCHTSVNAMDRYRSIAIGLRCSSFNRWLSRATGLPPTFRARDISGFFRSGWYFIACAGAARWRTGSHFAAFRFIVLSGLSFVANFFLTIFLHENLRIREEWAFAFLLALTTVMNFSLLRVFVYPGQHGGLLKQFGAFVA